MKIPAKNAGIASSNSSHFTSANEESIITPTIINAGAVASAGTMPTNGANKVDNRNRPAVTTAVKPVRPPAPIPAALST